MNRLHLNYLAGYACANTRSPVDGSWGTDLAEVAAFALGTYDATEGEPPCVVGLEKRIETVGLVPAAVAKAA